MRRVGLDSHYFQISDMTRWSFKKFVFFLNIFYWLIYVWLHWVIVAFHELPLVAAGRSCSPSWGAGFSSWWLPLLRSRGARAPAAAVLWAGAWAPQLWHTGLVAQQHVESSWMRAQTMQVSTALEDPNLLSSDIKFVWKLPLSYLEHCYYI